MESITLPDGSVLTQTTKLKAFDKSKKNPGHVPTPHTDTLQLPDGVATIEHDYVFSSPPVHNIIQLVGRI